MGPELVEVTMTAYALGCTGIEPKEAMRRAARAGRDERFASLLEARVREVESIACGEGAPGGVHAQALAGTLVLRRRAQAADLEHLDFDELLEVLPRVEIVRELLGPPDHIEALGVHPAERP